MALVDELLGRGVHRVEVHAAYVDDQRAFQILRTVIAFIGVKDGFVRV